MIICIDVTESELSNNDKELVKECLGLNEENLEASLKKLCKSAFMEYVKMFKEKGLPTRADEVQQERLYFLLNYFFENRLPSEKEISTIFQLTPSQSKTLLRNTKSRYRTKISTFIKQTLLQTLAAANKQVESSDYEFVCTSPTIIEELNQIISQKGPELKPIEKIKGLASKYLCSADSYDLLISEIK